MLKGIKVQLMLRRYTDPRKFDELEKLSIGVWVCIEYMIVHR